jgi:hypothetical protein
VLRIVKDVYGERPADKPRGDAICLSFSLLDQPNKNSRSHKATGCREENVGETAIAPPAGQAAAAIGSLVAVLPGTNASR